MWRMRSTSLESSCIVVPCRGQVPGNALPFPLSPHHQSRQRRVWWRKLHLPNTLRARTRLGSSVMSAVSATRWEPNSRSRLFTAALSHHEPRDHGTALGCPARVPHLPDAEREARAPPAAPVFPTSPWSVRQSSPRSPSARSATSSLRSPRTPSESRSWPSAAGGSDLAAPPPCGEPRPSSAPSRPAPGSAPGGTWRSFSPHTASTGTFTFASVGSGL